MVEAEAAASRAGERCTRVAQIRKIVNVSRVISTEARRLKRNLQKFGYIYRSSTPGACIAPWVDPCNRIFERQASPVPQATQASSPSTSHVATQVEAPRTLRASRAAVFFASRVCSVDLRFCRREQSARQQADAAPARASCRAWRPGVEKTNLEEGLGDQDVLVGGDGGAVDAENDTRSAFPSSSSSCPARPAPAPPHSPPPRQCSLRARPRGDRFLRRAAGSSAGRRGRRGRWLARVQGLPIRRTQAWLERQTRQKEGSSARRSGRALAN